MTGRPVTLKSGVALPSPGFGTWRMGETPGARAEEIAALRRAAELGFSHFDTAEMYGEGAAERVMAEAFEELDRDRLFLVSKVYPWNAGAEDMVRACEASLSRLGTGYLDLYLLHWPGSVPFEETLVGARRLKESGKIRAFGVSNFDTRGLGRLIDEGLADEIEVNQVMFNPARRGIEFDLLPLMRQHGIACVAYTPLEPDALCRNAGFQAVAESAGLTGAQLALAWHLSRGLAVPIPKAGRTTHVEALAAAAQVTLSTEHLAAIDAAFAPPTGPEPLDII